MVFTIPDYVKLFFKNQNYLKLNETSSLKASWGERIYMHLHTLALRIVFIYRPKFLYNQRIVHLTPIMNDIFIGFFSRKRSKSKTRKIGIII